MSSGLTLLESIVHRASSIGMALAVINGLGLVQTGRAASTVPVTFTASFARAPVVIDGTTLSTPTTLSWIPGSIHTLNLNTPQYLGTTSWIFSGWSDGGGGNAKAHKVVAPTSAETYTAGFVPQYELATHISPASGGGAVSVVPSSVDGYYWPTQPVTLALKAASGCQFVQFTGTSAGANSTLTISMAKTQTVTAQFSCSPNIGKVPVTFQGTFRNASVIVDGATLSTPVTLQWTPGSTHTLNLNTPQYVGTTSWIFSGWSSGGGGNGKAQSVVVPATATTYTADFVPQYKLSTSAGPSDGGSVSASPRSSNGYYWPTQTVQVSATAASNCMFAQFAGDASGTDASVSISMASAQNVAAEFSCATVPTGDTPAMQADSFVDSIGTNLHLSYNGTPYFENFPMIQQRLQQLGIRHVRDGLINTTWQGYYENLNALGKVGIKANLITAVGESASLLTSYPALVPQAFESYEGPNEYDLSGNPNWAIDLRSFQQALYQTVKGNSTTAQFPVIAPSLTSQQSFEALGNISAYYDSGNLHNYFGGRNPGTTGWGSDGYGSIQWNLNLAHAYDPTKPIITTETGYFTAPLVQQGIPDAQEGRYVPRVFLEQLNAGIGRTYVYELIDEYADQPANAEANYGLLYNDGSPKPAYTALRNVIKLLADPGPNFKAGGLTYSLLGNTANLQQSLFQKRDGTLYLALWLEVPSYDVNTLQVLPVTPQIVTVKIGQRTGVPIIYTLDDGGTMGQKLASFVSHSLTLSLTDSVTLIALPPAAK